MRDLGRKQRRFLLHLFDLRGRYNFTHLARYGKFRESTYRRQFAKPFD